MVHELTSGRQGRHGVHQQWRGLTFPTLNTQGGCDISEYIVCTALVGVVVGVVYEHAHTTWLLHTLLEQSHYIMMSLQ